MQLVRFKWLMSDTSEAVKKLAKHIAALHPNYVFDTHKNTVAITIEWKTLAPNFDIYTNTRTHWCKLTKSVLGGTKIVFISRTLAPTS